MRFVIPGQGHTGGIQIGASQLPLLASSIITLKLSAVSEASKKVMSVTLVGLVVNVAVGYSMSPVFGIFGIAAASCIATLFSTAMIMFATRAQSLLSWYELICIFATWLVIGAFAIAIHVKTLSVTRGAIFFCVLALFVQARTLIRGSAQP
jgi:hypothetical protein